MLKYIWGSSNGRTTGSGPVNRGSTPCPQAVNFCESDRYASLDQIKIFIKITSSKVIFCGVFLDFLVEKSKIRI